MAERLATSVAVIENRRIRHFFVDPKDITKIREATDQVLADGVPLDQIKVDLEGKKDVSVPVDSLLPATWTRKK